VCSYTVSRLHDNRLSRAGLSTRLTRLQPRAPDFFRGPRFMQWLSLNTESLCVILGCQFLLIFFLFIGILNVHFTWCHRRAYSVYRSPQLGDVANCLLPSSCSPIPFLHSPASLSRPLKSSYRRHEERCNFLHRGLGQSHSRNRIWCICILALK